MAKIFLDVNIAVDIIAQREPGNKFANTLVEYAAEELIELQFAESAVPTLLYIIIENHKMGAEGISGIIKFLNMCEMLSAPKQEYILALESPGKDKEDAMLYFVALYNKCDYFISYNKKDFQKIESAALPVRSTEEFLREIEPPAPQE